MHLPCGFLRRSSLLRVPKLSRAWEVAAEQHKAPEELWTGRRLLARAAGRSEGLAIAYGGVAGAKKRRFVRGRGFGAPYCGPGEYVATLWLGLIL